MVGTKISMTSDCLYEVIICLSELPICPYSDVKDLFFGPVHCVLIYPPSRLTFTHSLFPEFVKGYFYYFYCPKIINTLQLSNATATSMAAVLNSLIVLRSR